MTVRIFVGCAANHEDVESQAVLEYTLRKHASVPVKITWMMQSRDPDSWFYVGAGGWVTTGWATPFSGFRWIVPYLAKAEDYDRAIYMDSDFIVFGDIADLWNVHFANDKVVVANGSGRYCCSLWHVPRALAHLPDYKNLRGDANLHPRMTHYYGQHPGLVQPFARDNQWNWLDYQAVPLDQLAKRGIKAIHYTRVEQQLQIKHAKKRLALNNFQHWYTGKTVTNDWPGLQDLFDQLLEEAKLDSYPLERYMTEARFGSYTIRR